MRFFDKDKKKKEPVNDEEEEVKRLKARIEDLTKEKRVLTEEVETIKFKKRLEQEEIVHLQKINEERLKQEVESEKLKIQKKYADDISTFKEEQRKELVASLTNFHGKMEKRFNEELGNLKEVYSQQLSQLKELYGGLMKALPNVNFEITKHVGDAKYIEAPVEHKSKSK
jgi:archaellum component FlaC